MLGGNQAALLECESSALTSNIAPLGTPAVNKGFIQCAGHLIFILLCGCLF